MGICGKDSELRFQREEPLSALLAILRLTSFVACNFAAALTVIGPAVKAMHVRNKSLDRIQQVLSTS